MYAILGSDEIGGLKYTPVSPRAEANSPKPRSLIIFWAGVRRNIKDIHLRGLSNVKSFCAICFISTELVALYTRASCIYRTKSALLLCDGCI